jgi:glycosyltransferase involved in cell wall biosynthesis
MKYSIVIPTYNHCEKYLKPCIDSIIKYTKLEDIELIISANGCTDNTKRYIDYLISAFEFHGLKNNIKYFISQKPLGYAKATNAGIELATTDKVILLNNDTILLEQPKNQWLDMLEGPFLRDADVGISGPIVQHSPDANRSFCVFFCVMIDRKVFERIGLLNEEYGVGTGEDVEFCVEAVNAGFRIAETNPKTLSNPEFYVGGFPIYHVGEGTVHDANLVQDFNNVFAKNARKLARKYNPMGYKWSLMNNFERYMAIKGEEVLPREKGRYLWAASKMLGNFVLEVGCSNGYGSQFFGDEINYLGLDYDAKIIEVAAEEGWGDNKKFTHADINTFQLEQYDTIVAMEVIEHIDTGLEVVQRLKQHCKRLLVTVPYMETPGFWGEHHRLHMLNQSHLPGFTHQFMGEDGQISDTPFEGMNLMLCEYNA